MNAVDIYYADDPGAKAVEISSQLMMAGIICIGGAGLAGDAAQGKFTLVENPDYQSGQRHIKKDIGLYNVQNNAGSTRAKAVKTPKIFKNNKSTTNSSEVSSEKKVYIPKTPLKTQRINGQDIPLPSSEAGNNPHTTLGGRVGSDGKIYRQSATFPGETWPKANGKNVPWSRIDWTSHARPWDHSNPHQHVMQYDWNKKMWIVGSQEPFHQ